MSKAIRPKRFCVNCRGEIDKDLCRMFCSKKCKREFENMPQFERAVLFDLWLKRKWGKK